MKFSEKYKKEELENLIINQKLSYREIGRMYGVSDTYIKKVANKLGIILDRRKIFKNVIVPHNKGNGKKINCKNCGVEIYRPWHNQKYCSNECHNELKVREKYINYLNSQEEYGARPLKRIIQNLLEDFLSEEILKGNIKENEPITLKYKDENLVIVKKS